MGVWVAELDSIADMSRIMPSSSAMRTNSSAASVKGVVIVILSLSQSVSMTNSTSSGSQPLRRRLMQLSDKKRYSKQYQ